MVLKLGVRNYESGMSMQSSTRTPQELHIPFYWIPLRLESNVCFSQRDSCLLSSIAQRGHRLLCVRPLVHQMSSHERIGSWIFPWRQAAGIEQAHKQAISNHPNYDVQCYGENDPDWLAYFEWVNA